MKITNQNSQIGKFKWRCMREWEKRPGGLDATILRKPPKIENMYQSGYYGANWRRNGVLSRNLSVMRRRNVFWGYLSTKKSGSKMTVFDSYLVMLLNVPFWVISWLMSGPVCPWWPLMSFTGVGDVQTVLKIALDGDGAMGEEKSGQFLFNFLGVGRLWGQF